MTAHAVATAAADPAYHVVRNGEERWALWPDDLPVPRGWTAAYGPRGRQECLAWILDRPASPWILRDRGARRGRGPQLFVFPHSGGSPGEFVRWAHGPGTSRCPFR